MTRLHSVIQRHPDAAILRAYLALKREDAGRVRSYGAVLRYSGQDYAIISTYLDEPVGVNEAIRQALARITALRREGTALIIVKSHERAFLKRRNAYQLTQGIASFPVKLARLNPDDRAHGAGVLAADAYRRRSTIEEVL